MTEPPAAPPTAYVVHALPGRVRVRVPDRKGDAIFFSAMATRLQEIPGVVSVAANPLTGSALIHFIGEVEALALNAMTLLEDIQLELSPPPAQPMLERVHSEFAAVNASIRDLTGGEVDARAMLFVGLLAISVTQLLRGNIFAPAATLAWYAAELVRHWQLGEPQRAAGSEGSIPTG